MIAEAINQNPDLLGRLGSPLAEKNIEIDLYDGADFVLDSGAHTLIKVYGSDAWRRHTPTKPRTKVPKVRDTFDKLKKLARKMKGQLLWVAELDIYALSPYGRVLEMRKELQDEGHRVLPVWHSIIPNAYKVWDEWLEEFDYVGFTNDGLKDAPAMVMRAYDAGVKVHGFAITKTEVWYRAPLYSADSTTWTNPYKYGLVADPRGKFQVGKRWHPSKATAKRRLSRNRAHDCVPMVIRKYTQMAREITEFWDRKGVSWEQ